MVLLVLLLFFYLLLIINVNKQAAAKQARIVEQLVRNVVVTDLKSEKVACASKKFPPAGFWLGRKSSLNAR
jgi:hypothetical protein